MLRHWQFRLFSNCGLDFGDKYQGSPSLRSKTLAGLFMLPCHYHCEVAPQVIRGLPGLASFMSAASRQSLNS
jgi:hypothetical protein